MNKRDMNDWQQFQEAREIIEFGSVLDKIAYARSRIVELNKPKYPAFMAERAYWRELLDVLEPKSGGH